jgi:hypothetical protein
MEITLRCSSLPMAFMCAQSSRKAAVDIDTTGEPAGVGSCVHRALSPFVEGMSPGVALDTAFAEFPLIDRDDVGPLFWAGAKMWEKIRGNYPNPRTEIPLTATIRDGEIVVTLSGHIDVLAVEYAARRARGLDWKSGFLDSDYHHQGFGYAALVMLNDSEIDEVVFEFGWLRSKETEQYTITRARMMDWLTQLMAEVVQDERYHHGPHCGHCHRNHDCEAVTSMVKRDVGMFSDGAIKDLQAMDGPQFCAYRRKVKYLAALLKEADEHSKTEVERRGGSVEDGEGGVIHFVTQNGKRVVDAEKATPILVKLLTAEDLAACVTISIKTAEDLVAQAAGKGKGAAAKRALNDELKEAQAITQGTVKKLVDERLK